jgi:hypothetical protein
VICPMDWGEPSGCDLVFEVTPAVSVNQRRDRMNLSLYRLSCFPPMIDFISSGSYRNGL